MSIKDGIKLGFGLCAGRCLWTITETVMESAICMFIIETDFVGKESKVRKNAEATLKRNMPRTYDYCVERGRIQVEQETRRKIGF